MARDRYHHLVSLPMTPSPPPVVPVRRRRTPPLLVRLYAIGIATAIGIAGSWYGAHKFIHFQWGKSASLGLEVIREIPSRWKAGHGAARGDAGGPNALQEEVTRLRHTSGLLISVYDTDGKLMATNVQPSFPPPTLEQRRKAAAGQLETPWIGSIVTPVRLGNDLVGFCVFDRELLDPPFWGVMMDLLIISTWISAVGFLVWRTLVRPLQSIARAAEAFGEGDMLARTGVDRGDEIGKVARAFDEMSERIARSREAERELLAGVSHELRTPMARIRVALDLAAEGDAETARASLIDVAEDLTELETLIGNIFSTTRLERAAWARDDQAVPLQRVDVDLAALVEKAVVHQRAQHPQRPYSLEVAAGASGNNNIYADAVLIRRAIENVLDNAHKYSPPGAPVSVQVTGDARAFRIAIVDHGFGIGPEDLSRVCSPFFRADRSRTRATGGVGLGLALAKRVVEAHGGSINVASRLEVGTTVTFLVPIADGRHAADAVRNIS
jgi:two-component system OmpR family sensor kinase